MNESMNLTNILSIYLNSDKYLTTVNQDIEVFVGISQKIFFTLGIFTSLTNLIIFLVIFKVNKSQKTYYMMQINCTFRLLAGLIYAFINDTACIYCKNNYYNSLFILIYKSYFITVIGDILPVIIGSFEILIILDRLSILNRSLINNFFRRQDIKCTIPIIIFVSFLIISPDIFIINIFEIGNGVYYRELTNFSKSIIYNYVFISLRTIYIFILICIYIKLVVSLLLSYNDFLERKRRCQIKRNQVKRNERDLIKLIIFQSTLNLTGSFFFTTCQLIRRYEIVIKEDNPNNYYRGDLIITDYSFIIIALICLSIADIAIFAYDTRIQKLFTKIRSNVN